MRRKTRLSIRRKMSGTLACLLTAISVLSTSGAVPTMASDSKVKMSYKQENIEKIGIHVEAENESFSAGESVLLNVYIQNNSGEPLKDGTLKWVDKKETLSQGGFLFESENDMTAAEEATPDSAEEAEAEETPVPETSAAAETVETEAVIVEETETPEETVAEEDEAPETTASETEAAPAGPSEETTAAAEADSVGPAGPSEDAAPTQAAGPASDNGDDFGTAWEDDWFDENEDDEDDAEIEGQYLDENGNICNIDLAPGEIFTVQFAGTIDEDIHGLRNRDLHFTFGARKPNGKRLSNNIKFQFNTGLMTMLPVEFEDGNLVETNEENTMVLRLGLDDIEYMFEEIEESKETAVVGTLSEAEKASPSEVQKASPSEAEKEEFTAAEVIRPETPASPSEAEMASPSEAEKAAEETIVEVAATEEEETEASPSETAKEDAEEEDEADEEDSKGLFHPEDVKYTIETYGVRLKGIKAKFDADASGPAESVTEVSYRVASGTEPGLYFGTVTASVKYNGNTYKSVQGFHINVTGEDQMVLRGMFNDSEVIVSGPAESFPDGEILSLKITEITEEQRMMLEEALKKLKEETGTVIETMTPMDIKVIADGEPQELCGLVEVTFCDLELEKVTAKKQNSKAGTEKIGVWHLDEENVSMNEMSSIISSDGDVVMQTDHFSVYIPGNARPVSSVEIVESAPAPGVTVKVFDYNNDVNTTGLGPQGYSFFQGDYVADAADTKEGSVDGVYAGNKDVYNKNNKPLMHATLMNGYPYVDSKVESSTLAIQGSMDYLFNDTYLKKTMADGGGLFQKDENGYFYYDSQFNSAYYNDGKFTLYNTAVRPKYTQTEKTDVRWGNFLPFNEVAGNVTVDDTLPNGTQSAYLNNPVDLWFGMTVEFDFFMPKDGLLDGNAMKFDFHGDDDVYVYIDDVLVLNIGGTHGAESATIDFQTGIATDPNGNAGNGRKLKEIFEAAGKTNVAMDGNTFADYTKHKLKFFYMERGGNISYCRLRFNMPILPDNSLTVTKELTAADADVTAEMEEYIKNNSDYQFKFRVVKANDNGTTSSELFVPADTQYEILQDGVSMDPKQYGTVGLDGYFSLKPGQSAQFTNMLALGQQYGNYNYKVEEVMPNSLKAQYNGAVISIGSVAGVLKIGTVSGSFTTLSTEILRADEVNAVTYCNEINTEKTVNISVIKQWEDKSNVCEGRPESVTFRLYLANGTEETPYNGNTQTITLRHDTWTGSFNNLPMYDASGNKITYVVREMDGENPLYNNDALGKYTVTYSPMTGSETEKQVTITNTHKHKITVSKEWYDDALDNHDAVYYGVFKMQDSGLTSVDGEAHELKAGRESEITVDPASSTDPYVIRELKEVKTAAEADFTDTTTGKATSGKHFKIIDDGGRFGDFYKVTYTPSNGEAAACEQTVTITNTLSKAIIKIGKWIDNYEASLKDDTFIIKVDVAGGETKTGLVLNHEELSAGIEVYAGDGKVEVEITEIVPKEYDFKNVTQGTDKVRGSEIASSNGQTVEIDVSAGDEVVLWVHNTFTHKNYFHNDADALNEFDPAEKPETLNIETAAIVPERRDWEQLLKETEMM